MNQTPGRKGTTPVLEFDAVIPEGAVDGTPWLILLHGRGGDKNDLMRLLPHWPQDLVVLAPRAPFPASDWGYGPGWAWYRLLELGLPEPETFEAAQRHLETFIEALPQRLGLRPGRLVVGGFSQGATMSTAYALRNPGRVHAVIHLAGFLARHPSVRVEKETVGTTAFFWAHGTQDTVVPFSLAVEGRRRLAEAGARLTAKDYPIGHRLDVEVIRDAAQWFRQVVNEENPDGLTPGG